MSDVIKLVTVLTREQALEFISSKEKKLEGVDALPDVNPKIKEAVRSYVGRNIGYDKAPIAGLSKYNGSPGELRTVGTNVSDYIPTMAGTVLFELHMPEDMVVSVSFKDLLDFSSMLETAEDESEEELILEDFSDRIKVGYPGDDSDDYISFIPFIDLNKCKFFAMVDRSWGIGNFSVPGVEQIKLTSMEVF